MGKRINGDAETEIGGTGGSSGNTPTTGSGNGRGRGRGRGTGSTEEKSTEKSVGLSNVKEPKIVSVDIPKTEIKTVDKKTDDKPKRGRPSGSTSKKSTAAKQKGGTVDHTHISILLVTMSGVISTRPNMQPFAMTLEEANQIAMPLANILAKNEGIASAASEYADHIALLFAAATILIPKVLMYQSLKPTKETRGIPHEPNTSTNRNIGNNEARTIDRSSEATNRQPPNPAHIQGDSGSFNGSIGEFLAPINGF